MIQTFNKDFPKVAKRYALAIRLASSHHDVGPHLGSLIAFAQ